jgi:hypothetical protein
MNKDSLIQKDIIKIINSFRNIEDILYINEFTKCTESELWDVERILDFHGFQDDDNHFYIKQIGDWPKKIDFVIKCCITENKLLLTIYKKISSKNERDIFNKFYIHKIRKDSFELFLVKFTEMNKKRKILLNEIENLEENFFKL